MHLFLRVCEFLWPSAHIEVCPDILLRPEREGRGKKGVNRAARNDLGAMR